MSVRDNKEKGKKNYHPCQLPGTIIIIFADMFRIFFEISVRLGEHQAPPGHACGVKERTKKK
jgi:hypothetical protein